jgi:hypothetical protein
MFKFLKQKRTVLKNTGYKFMRPNPKARQFKTNQELTLPATVDLRPFLSPIEDQQDTNSCTANAVAGAYEYLIKRHLSPGEHYDVSRLFIYYNGRLRDGSAHQDEGSSIQYAMEGTQRFGACSENTWPFKKKLVCARPPAQSYKEASQFAVSEMEQIATDLVQWKRCLAEGYPIVFGCALFESFDDCNKVGGVVRMPGGKELNRGEHGLHAMLCVGYSDVESVFIVRNSWGTEWGDKGYCYIPYNYLMNKSLNDGDNWVMRATQAIPTPEATWSNEDKPVTNGGLGVAFLINEVAPVLLDALATAFFNHAKALEFDSTLPDVLSDTLKAVESSDWDFIDSLPEIAESEEDEGDEDEGDEDEDEEDEDEEDEEDEDEEDEDEEDEDEEDEDDEDEDEEDEDEEDEDEDRK